jgi:hypothetical protein
MSERQVGCPRVLCNSRITSLWGAHFGGVRESQEGIQIGLLNWPSREKRVNVSEAQWERWERVGSLVRAECSPPGSREADSEGGKRFCVAQRCRRAGLLGTFLEGTETSPQLP